MVLREWIEIISNLIIALSALAATIFAYRGIRAWRKELKGKSEYQIAKDVLRAVYKARDAFSRVRNPAIMAYEYPEEMRGPAGHLKDEFRKDGAAHVYTERFKVLDESFRELEDRVLDAQVEWEADFGENIKPMRMCRARLLIAIRNHVDMQDSKSPRKYSDEQVEEIDWALYDADSPDYPNPFSLALEVAIDGFEEKLRPHIRA